MTKLPAHGDDRHREAVWRRGGRPHAEVLRGGADHRLNPGVKLQVAAGRLYKLLPKVVHEDKLCEWCEIAMVSDRPSRSGKPPTPRCPECRHIESSRCACETCRVEAEQLARLREQRQRQDLIESHVRRRAEAREPGSLTLRERVVLAAFLRGNKSEDPMHVAPLESVPVPITPSEKWTGELLRELVWDAGLLVINPHSDLSAFNFPEGEPWRYFPFRVWCELNTDPRLRGGRCRAPAARRRRAPDLHRCPTATGR